MSETFKSARSASAGFGSQAARAGYGVRDSDDPLAELARLVGKDDPFRRTPAARHEPVHTAELPGSVTPLPRPSVQAQPEPSAFGQAGTVRTEPGFADFDAQLRGSLDQRGAESSRPRDALRFPALPAPVPHGSPLPDPFEAPQDVGEAAPLQADLWAEGLVAQEPEGSLPFDQPLHEEDRAPVRSPRRTLAVLAAVLALTAGGIGATFLMHGSSTALTRSGDAPTILASESPVKVASPDAANGGAPEASTALLEKTGSDNVAKAKVTNTQERPVDLAQLPKPAGNATDDAAGAAPAQNPFPEPRKVKTVLIRPDGSVVGDPVTPPAADPSSSVGGVVMPSLAAVDTTPTASNPADPTPTPAVPPSAPVAKPSTPKSTARVSSTPKTVDPGHDAATSGAKQASAPVRTPKPKPVVTADATPAPAVTPGTYAVQLAAPGTEQDAKDVASRLQKKFADELAGMHPSIHKGESGTRSVYRVRVSNLSQDDAKTLCTKLQAGGGTCFVVRN